MNRFGVKETKPKILFGVLPEKNNRFKIILVGKSDECKSNFLTQFAGNNFLHHGMNGKYK